MNVIHRAKAFVQSLQELASRSAWDWRRCPRCGDTLTIRYGSYRTRPWFLDGRQERRIRRHRCHRCRLTYSERSGLIARGSWYAREVHRCGIDHWQHVGSSLRRTAEHLRSLMGRQERWLMWRPLDEPPPPERECHLAPSTIHRWLDRAGREARKTVPKQLEGVAFSGQTGADGLWARIRGRAKRVVLVLGDCVTGVIYPPVVVKNEDESGYWGKLFRRARLAGLDFDELRGLVSDGTRGLGRYVSKRLEWVNHQCCVFHLWRNLGGELSRQVAEAAAGLVGEAAEAARRQVRRELVALVHGVVDARTETDGMAALETLAANERGGVLAKIIGEHGDELFVHLKEHNLGLRRVAPEWLWRDFRLRLSRGRNHGSDERLERAALVWAIYRNFTPAQRRSEQNRHYRHPGLSPLEVAGVHQGTLGYLDALSV